MHEPVSSRAHSSEGPFWKPKKSEEASGQRPCLTWALGEKLLLTSAGAWGDRGCPGPSAVPESCVTWAAAWVPGLRTGSCPYPQRHMRSQWLQGLGGSRKASSSSSPSDSIAKAHAATSSSRSSQAGTRARPGFLVRLSCPQPLGTQPGYNGSTEKQNEFWPRPVLLCDLGQGTSL